MSTEFKYLISIKIKIWNQLPIHNIIVLCFDKCIIIIWASGADVQLCFPIAGNMFVPLSDHLLITNVLWAYDEKCSQKIKEIFKEFDDVDWELNTQYF